MSNLPLGFAMIAVGALATTVGFSKSHSFRDVLAGSATLEDSSDAPGAVHADPGRRPTPAQQANPAAAKTQRDSSGQPLASGGAGGFAALPGTDFSRGSEPQIVARLSELGRRLHTTIYGISGYRSPAHSVEVGGFANDPHTRGEGADVGFGNATRSSFGLVSNEQLASVGLFRPFAGEQEINHVALR